MPSPWRAVKDQTTGSDEYYFWNQQTDETSWDLPAGYMHVEGQPYLQPIAPPPAYETPVLPPRMFSGYTEVKRLTPPLLNCPCCQHLFVAGDNPRRPLLLGCGHTVCSDGVSKSLSADRLTAVCAVCRLVSFLPFSPNFALEELIGSLADLSGGANGQCAECDAHATVFCMQCKAQLCPEHDKTIHSFKSSSGHTRGALSSSPPSFVPPSSPTVASSSSSVVSDSIVRMCTTHPEEALKIFCLTCQIPICRDCKDFAPAHAGHSTNLVTNVVASNRNLLDGEANKLKEISQIYLNELATCLEKEHNLDTLAHTVKISLKQDVAMMMEKLKQRHFSLEEQISQFLTNNKAIIRRHRQEVLFAYSNVAVTQEECVRVAALPGADLLGQLKGTLSHSIAAASQHPSGVPPTLLPASLSLEGNDAISNWGRLNSIPVRVGESKVETKETVVAPVLPSTPTNSSNTVLSASGFPVPKRPVNPNKVPTLRPFTVSTPNLPGPVKISSPSSSSSSLAVTPAPPLKAMKDHKLRALAATTDPNLMSLGPQLEFLRKGTQSDR